MPCHLRCSGFNAAQIAWYLSEQRSWKYTIRGLSVLFPFAAYNVQVDYMDKVIQALQERRNALLESPTGTGKTLALLCSTISWRNSMVEKKDDSLENIPKIVYSSRTHSQLFQVVKELRHCPYSSSLKGCVLGSRSQLCIHPSVLKYNNVGTQNLVCRTMKRCPYREALHKSIATSSLNDVDDDSPQYSGCKSLMDIEDLVKLGRARKICPYYWAREIAKSKSTGAVFVPYNYLVDPHVRTNLKLSLNGAVVVVDEAHNLDNSCCEASSWDLSSGDLAGCISEVQQALVRTQQEDYDGECDTDDLAKLKSLLLALESEIDQIKLPPSGGKSFKGRFLRDELFPNVKINDETAPLVTKLIEQVVLLLEKASTVSRVFSLAALAENIDSVFRVSDYQYQCFKVHLSTVPPKPGLHSSKRGWSLGFWCFSPSFAMEKLISTGPRSLVLTSGTLSPLTTLESELGLNNCLVLENPHVVSDDRIWIGVLRQGPSGFLLNSSYATREDPKYKTALGNTIINFIRLIPGGVLVFFPSYGTLSSCLQAWKTEKHGAGKSIYEAINRIKGVVVEPRQSSLFQAAQEEFKTKLKDTRTKGALFFAVARGKVSEGMDFADDNARAVLVTGLPYPMLVDPKVVLKRQYMDERRDRTVDGSVWYSQEAVRAVNQCIGRVIRHVGDHGAIILCDLRFGGPPKGLLSRWLRSKVQDFRTFGEATASIARFFKRQNSMEICTSHSVQPVVSPDVVEVAPVVSPDVVEVPRPTLTSSSTAPESSSKAGKPSGLFDHLQTYNVKTGVNRAVPRFLEAEEKPCASECKDRLNDSKAVRNAEAQAFLEKLRSELALEEYQLFRHTIRAVKAFSREHKKAEIDEQMQKLFPVFQTPQRSPLWDDFVAFFSPHNRDRYRFELLSQAAGDTAFAPSGSTASLQYDLVTGQSLPKAKRQRVLADPSTCSSNHSSCTEVSKEPLSGDIPEHVSDTTAEETKEGSLDLLTVRSSRSGCVVCSVCQETAQDPHSAKCGHVCCFKCWDRLLDVRLECPLCRHRVRKKQLQKLFLS